MGNKPDRLTFQNRLDEIVAAIRRDIGSGTRRNGDYLPSERMLAEQFQSSVKMVRRALDILVSEGFIEKVPRVGNKITGASGRQTASVKLGCYPSVMENAGFRELLNRFRLQHPDLRVDMLTVPYVGFKQSVELYMDNDILDAVTLNGMNFLEIAEADALERFEPLSERAECYPFLNRTFTRDGLLYAAPFVFSPVVLCYNKDLFREMRMPEPDSSWTWETLTDISCKIKEERDLFGFYAHISSVNRFPIFLMQQPFLFDKENPSAGLDDPRLWESLRRCRELIYSQGGAPAFLSETDADAETVFAQQKAAMIMTTYYSLNQLGRVPFEYDLAPLPHGHLAKTLLLVTGFGINRGSANKEAARVLIDFLTSESSQTFMRQHSYDIPAHKLAAEWTGKETLFRPSRYSMYREIVPTFGGYEDLNLPMDLLNTLRNELRMFWANMEEPEEVARRLHDTFT